MENYHYFTYLSYCINDFILIIWFHSENQDFTYQMILIHLSRSLKWKILTKILKTSFADLSFINLCNNWDYWFMDIYSSEAIPTYWLSPKECLFTSDRAVLFILIFIRIRWFIAEIFSSTIKIDQTDYRFRWIRRVQIMKIRMRFILIVPLSTIYIKEMVDE